MKHCLHCDTPLEKYQVKFCSNKCQINHQHYNWVLDWKQGKVNGGVGVTARNISKHLKRYLIESNGDKCSQCGWDKKHPTTGIIPLEIDHIDGNAENNAEYNLRLLCPNCHALTPFYKNMNRGSGRAWRVKKYIKNPKRPANSISV